MNVKISYTWIMNTPLIVALDVDYRETLGIGVAGAVWFRGWESDVAMEQHVIVCQNIAPYVPGAFYQRELPCLLEVLKAGPEPDFIIIDGYVWVGEGKMGLGAHLGVHTKAEVIGVAKTHYPESGAVEVRRGGSSRPLYVGATSIDAQVAGSYIASMHGPNRNPTMLKAVDRLGRDHFLPESASDL